jgi:hypothetical protein
MYGLGEYEVLRQPHEGIQREVPVEHPTRMAREKRETRSYVGRALSWELARYLDPEGFSESATATPTSASGSERKSG